MRSFLVGAVLGVGLGVAGMLLFRSRAEPSPSDAPVPARRATPGASPPPAPAHTGPLESEAAILRRLTAVETELRRLVDALVALPKDAAAGSPASPTTAVGPAPSPDDVRRRWTEVLDRMEEQLRAIGPQDDRDPVLWSRWDDVKRARKALAEAQTLEDLQRLSEGEFKSGFKWP
jgi:hypothetical protein